MKTAEATTIEKTAAVAEQGAPVAPQTASSKKAASQKKGAPKGLNAAKEAQPKPAARKKGAKASTKAAKPAPAKEASTPRPESKGAKILGTDRAASGRHTGRDSKSHRLAGP